MQFKQKIIAVLLLVVLAGSVFARQEGGKEGFLLSLLADKEKAKEYTSLGQRTAEKFSSLAWRARTADKQSLSDLEKEILKLDKSGLAEAEEALKRARQKDDKALGLDFAIALVHERKGNYKEALQAYDAIAFGYNIPLVFGRKRNLQRELDWEKLGYLEGEKADEYAKKVLEDAKNAEKARYWVEKALKSGQYELALRLARQGAAKGWLDAGYVKKIAARHAAWKKEQEQLAKQKAEEKRKAEELAKQKAEEKRKAEELAKQKAEEKRKAEELAKQKAEEARKARQVGGLVYVAGGTFSMGSNNGEYDEKPVHSVRVSSFYMGKYEVTQELYQRVMGKNPSRFKGAKRPVEQVSWYDAVEFCNALSRQQGLTPCYTGSGENIRCNFKANGYRLPSEAEWEYAARGGVKSRGYKYAGSNNIDEVAEYDGNNNKETKPVGGKKPNELGLYDMTGNVWEWCWDWYDRDYYRSSPGQDPLGPNSGSGRVLRGGSWYVIADVCRTANRLRDWPDNRDFLEGFRLARSLAP